MASIPPAAVQDVAKLQFAMSIMWMYFFWSQYLVIWYGNVPIETRFFVRRFFVQPWQTLAWVVLVVGWLIPFAYLLKRLTGRPPQRHAPLFIVAVFGLVAIFLERVLVDLPLGLRAERGCRSGCATSRSPLGFLSLFALSRRWFMARYKPVLNLPHTGALTEGGLPPRRSSRACGAPPSPERIAAASRRSTGDRSGAARGLDGGSVPAAGVRLVLPSVRRVPRGSRTLPGAAAGRASGPSAVRGVGGVEYGGMLTVEEALDAILSRVGRWGPSGSR